jgi:hypothetical protein
LLKIYYPYKVIILLFLISLNIFADEIRVNKIEYIDSDKIPFKYTIHIDYPQLELINKTEVLDKINGDIKNVILNISDEYKGKLNDYASLPGSNEAYSWFEVYFQVFSSKDIFSFSFFIYKYFPNENIPITSVKSFNFDLSTGNQLSLEDMFLSNSDYLSVLSINTAAYLKSEIDEDPDEALYDYNSVIEGTKPEEKNYQHFNISPLSFIIIFEPYHFGIKANRFVQAEIPFDKFKTLMKR